MTQLTTDKALLSNASRLVTAEVGKTALPTVIGMIRDDFYRELEFPLAAKTFKNMSYHPTVASAISVIEDTVRRVNWTVEVPKDASPEFKTRAEFIETCMVDMDRSWSEYINEFLSILTYGFSVNEKVWKRRKKAKDKSKFDDGLFGWKRLPSRNQASIKRWVYDDEGRDLIGVIQDLSQVKGGSERYAINGTLKGIPRDKFLLFRHNAKLDNPEGNSPLKHVWIPWKYLTTIEEYEAVGTARDMNGMPMVKLPPEYMAADASDAKKEVFEAMKQLVRNINANEQAGIVFPTFVDPETKADAFSFELVGTQGSKNYDTDKICRRYEQKILMAFLADVLLLGHANTGSMALASEKTSLLSVKIAAILDQVVDIINTDLIPSTFRKNGWDASDTPKIVYDDFEKTSLDEVGKLVQRAVTSGAMEVDKGMSDYLRELIAAPEVDEDKPITMINPNKASEAGNGMEEGMPGGNGSASGNNSATNSDNAS